jgi:hypothetical protein
VIIYTYPTRDEGMDFGDRNRALFKQYLNAHPVVLLKITPVLPESSKLRRCLEGAIGHVPSARDRPPECRRSRRVREWLKLEFNWQTVMVAGKAHKIAKSTRVGMSSTSLWRMSSPGSNYAPPAQAPEVCFLIRNCRLLGAAFAFSARLPVPSLTVQDLLLVCERAPRCFHPH